MHGQSGHPFRSSAKSDFERDFPLRLFVPAVVFKEIDLPIIPKVLDLKLSHFDVLWLWLKNYRWYCQQLMSPKINLYPFEPMSSVFLYLMQ